jgi:hypothetical protein
LADLIYSLAMSRVLITMRQALVTAGLESVLNFSDNVVAVQDVSYVDDLAVPVVGDSALALVPKVSRITTVVFVTFKLYGMDLNFEKGKSAAILNFKGVDQRSARESLDSDNYLIKIDVTPCKQDVFLKVDMSYQHLGTLTSYQGMGGEIAYRCGLMKAETSKMLGLLRNSSIPFRKKIY